MYQMDHESSSIVLTYFVVGQALEVPTCMLGAIAEMRSQPEMGLQRKQFLGNGNLEHRLRLWPRVSSCNYRGIILKN